MLKKVCWNKVSQSHGKIDLCLQYNKICIIETETIYTMQHLVDISEQESHGTQSFDKFMLFLAKTSRRKHICILLDN